MGKFKFGVTILIPLVLLALLAACAQPTPAPMPVVQSRGLTYLSELQVAGETELNGAVTINNNAVITGTLGVTGTTTLTGGLAANGGAVVKGPTAAATATPALLINNLGVANDALVVAKAGTPVFKVSNAGLVTGNVLQYGSSGQKVVCNTSTITGTGTLAHGLATPSVVMVSLAGDANGDHARVSSTNASATVTVKTWSSALTPAPATTPVAVDWCVIGTP